MLKKLDVSLQKWIPLLTPLTVILGVTIFSFVQSLSFLVPWVFAFITFTSCLGLNISNIRNTLTRPLPIIVCLLFLQVIIPLFVYGIGLVLFKGDAHTITGLVLAYTIPTGVISLMWVAIYEGDRALTLSIILINTLLSPILVPLSIKILLGAQVGLDTFGLISSLFWMIVAPSILGIIATKGLNTKAKSLKATLNPFSKVGMLTVLLINSSVVSPFFTNVDGKVILIGCVVFLFASGAYIIGLVVARLLHWDREVAISLMYNTGMRNNGAGAAIAVVYFPPAVAFPIVIAILFQQFLASTFGRLANVYFSKWEKKIIDFLKPLLVVKAIKKER